MSMGTVFWLLTAVICLIFLVISWRVRGDANKSFSSYAIGSGSFNLWLIFFTQFASIMGVSNFFSHAGNAYVQGVGILAFILGEQGSKIVFALTLAGLIGKFTYNTLPEMIDDLIVRDKLTRAMAAVMASLIMIASVGGQAKAFGDLFEVFTGVNSAPIVILFSLIFIVYTVFGGVYSVVWTDLFQGIMCLIFGIIFYAFMFSRVDFSFAVLQSRLADLGKAELLSFSSVSGLAALNKFLTGLVGVMIFQVYWQRCFSCRSAKDAKRSMLSSGIICLLFVFMTAFSGLIIMTYNQGLNANNAMPWFMMNVMPGWLCACIFVLVLCAGMSTADSCLNSAAVLIVNDLIKPFRNDNDAILIRDTKIVTVIIGIVSCFCGIYAQTILSLLSKAYSFAGAGVVPVIVIGLLWRERNEPHDMGRKNSRVTPWAARVGILAGAIISQIKLFGDYAVIAGVAISSVLIIVISLLTANVPTEPIFLSKGDVHPLHKDHGTFHE
ncbi:MAG: sodium:solute symporter family protein [Lachnospiraceae bacterium]|nr:sodium:solute symporter family protein [Lachnospiraceae bacterium]